MFRRNGILRVEEPVFQEAVEYLDRVYFKPLEEGRGVAGIALADQALFAEENNPLHYKEGGTEINVNISFKDPHLAPLLFHPDLNGVLYNYYRRQPYYRNQPLLQKISYSGKLPPLSNSNWHVDYTHQVSIMLLVSDVTQEDTHMQYAIGSHKKIRRVGNFSADVLEKEGGYPVLDVVGRKGTLFMFDAGGLHRACYKAATHRKILHLNMTTGHHITDQRFDRLENWPALATYPSYSRRMMDRVGQRSL